MNDFKRQQEATQRYGSQYWADTQQPIKDGKINHDFYKVYGDKGLKEALNQ